MRKTRFTIAILLTGIAVVASCWILRLHTVDASAAHSSSPNAAPQASAPTTVTVAKPTAAPPRPIKPSAADRRPARIPQELRERLQRRRSLNEANYEATDLHAFVQSILLVARGGDVEAQAAIAAALGECSDVETSKHGPKNQTFREELADSATPGRSLELAGRELGRCEPLLRASTDEVGTEDAWLRQAAAGGQGPAMLDLEDLPDSATADQAIAEVRRAIGSGDPDVLAQLIGSYHRDDASRQGAADVDMTFAIVTRIRCDLGDDCSSTDPEFQIACPGSACGQAGNELERVRASLTDQQWVEAGKRAATLINEFYSGRDDWPEAQAYENSIRAAAKNFATGRLPSSASSAAIVPVSQ